MKSVFIYLFSALYVCACSASSQVTAQIECVLSKFGHEMNYIGLKKKHTAPLRIFSLFWHSKNRKEQ